MDGEDRWWEITSNFGEDSPTLLSAMPLKTVAPGLFRRHDDEAAFERLYERNVEGVYRYALGMLGDAADAEDVTQTTFLNAYRAFKGGTHPEKPHSWLIAIAHNVCRQRFRQAQRRPREVAFDEGIGEAETVEPSTPSAEDLRRALSELPQNQRAALVMRELEGSSYAEIAGVLGVSVSALETLLFRARRSLREQLEERLTCQAAVLAIDKQLDGRLSGGERRALRAHLRACSECNSLAQSQRAQRRALKALVIVPLPLTIAHWAAPSAASAATGAGGLAVAGSGGAGAGTGAGAGAGASSAVLGGVAAKVAAVVVAGVMVGGAYEGVKHIARGGQASAASVEVASKRSEEQSKPGARTIDATKRSARTAKHARHAGGASHASGQSSTGSGAIASRGGNAKPAGHTVDATAPTQDSSGAESAISAGRSTSPPAANASGSASTASGASKAVPGPKTAPGSQAVAHSQAASHSQAAQHSNAASHSQAAQHSNATPHSQSGSQGATTTAPGNSGNAPGHSNPPGNSGSAGTPPGQTSTTPGNSGTAPGNSTDPPGNSTTAPGHSSDPPGNSGDSKGKGK